MEEIIKSVKGFNRDMTCDGNGHTKLYKEGHEYEEPDAEACKCGMHACEYPLDCFSYYPPNKSVYHEVEQSGKISEHFDDSKIASTKMKIGAEINIAGMVKAAIEYTMKRTKKNKGCDEDYGAASSTGYKGAAEATDSESVAVAWGYKGRARGVIGSHLVLANWEGDERYYSTQDKWNLKGAKMVRVDGEKIKENTWYTIKNGEVVEDEE